MPQRISDQNKPYIFTEGPSPEEAATLTAEFIGKQAGPGKAQFAGNDATKNKNRVYGIVHYDTPDGQYKGLFDTLKAQLKKYKITAKADQSFFLDLSRAQENARTIITKMKDAGVTTVIYTGDPLTPGSVTKEATAQDYHPEWILGPSVLADTSIFARTFDQEQWSHAIGVALVPGRTPQDLNATHNCHTGSTARGRSSTTTARTTPGCSGGTRARSARTRFTRSATASTGTPAERSATRWASSRPRARVGCSTPRRR